MIEKIEKIVEKRIPKFLRDEVKKSLDYAGEDVEPGTWLARNIIIIFLLSVLTSIVPFIFKDYFIRPPYFTQATLPYVSLFLFLVSLVFFTLIVYFGIYYKIEWRRSRCQKILPDFLSNVAMNLNAGMEPLAALYISLRPDFNPITDEMKKIRSLALGSKSIVEQLSLLKNRIDSQPLRTTITIIERASRSGGNLAKILEAIARDLRETNELQRELESITKGYVYFIVFLILLGIPMLLSVASLFIKLVSAPTEGLVGPGPIFLTFFVAGEQKAVVPVGERVDLLFILLLSFSAITASLMFGIILSGSIRSGVKYIPILLPITLIIFFLFREFILNLLHLFGVF